MNSIDIIKNNKSDYLRILFDQSPGIITIHDLNEKCIFVSPSSKTILGYESKELLNLSIRTLIHPNDIEKVDDIFNKLSEEIIKPLFIRYRIRHKEQHYVWFEALVRKMSVNKDIGEQIFWFNRDITDKKLIEDDLIESQEQFKTMFNHNSIGMALVSTEGQPIKCNKSLVDMLGYSEEQICQHNLKHFTHPEDLELDSQLFKECVSGKREYYQIEKRFIRKDRVITWGRLTVSVVWTAKSTINYIVFMIEDISEQKKMQKSLETERIKYKNLVEDALVGVYTIQKGKLVYVNRRLEEISGYTSEELYQTDFINLFHQNHQKKVEHNMKKRFNNEAIDPSAVYNLVRKDKKVITIEINAQVSNIDGIPTLTGTVMDITARKKAEEKVNKMAYYDGITNLPNRYSLEEFYNTYAMPGKNFALLFIELDRFNMINNTRGHRFGDLLIERVAQRLSYKVKDLDYIARYGEAEFIILKQFDSVLEISSFAQEVLNRFSNSIVINGYEIFPTISIGISIYESDGYDFDTLVKNADVAMYDAMERGGNNFQFYTSLINDKVSRKIDLEFAIRKAIENNEFTLHYQPKFHLISNEIIGVEALLRWKHPKYGMISPAEFIPIAEETGLIIPLGAWVLEAACQQFKTLDKYNITLAVNISALQIQQGGFFKRVRDTLFKTGFNPKLLELELTESIMHNNEETFMILDQLKSLGIKLSIDDFGTGYSSLSILKDLPVHTIKIDRSFIHDLMDNYKTNALVRAIIDLGLNLNYEIVAEGIESAEQIELLKLYKCQIGQGFFYSKPVKFIELEEMILKSNKQVNRF